MRMEFGGIIGGQTPSARRINARRKHEGWRRWYKKRHLLLLSAIVGTRRETTDLFDVLHTPYLYLSTRVVQNRRTIWG